MLSIKVAKKLKGKKVLLRLDLNVSFSQKNLADDYRIRKSKPTINFLSKAGAKIIIVSHRSDSKSLKSVSEALNFKFIGDILSLETKGEIENMSDGDIFVAENLRLHPEEEKNDENFSKYIAELADIYVNESFSTSHRKHASIVGIPKFIPAFAGLRLIEEIENLSQAFNPGHPFLFILGGAKFETKLPLIEKFLNITDNIFIGGALAVHVPSLSISKNPKIILPDGNIAALDSNTETLKILEEKISLAKFILWNGPLGNFEKGYTEGTEKLAKMVADSGAKTIIGGGDTLTSIENLNLEEKFSFVSTGGGAMLDFLANETLPGIEALENTK